MTAGRRIGSRVKLLPFWRRLYPQFVGKTGKVVKREIHVKGRGLASGFLRSPYKVAYWVRWDGETRDYLLGADMLTRA